MDAITWYNGAEAESLSILDRGLAYGDGVFETIRVADQSCLLLESHLKRLELGLSRLGFAEVNQISQQIGADLSRFMAAYKFALYDAVIKVTVTRGSAGRGYLAPEAPVISRIISCFPLPSYPAENSQDGVKVRLCKQTLAINPELAGIKHLNRLEQVLARNEWRQSDIAEGLLFDRDGQLCDGTVSNVFYQCQGQWFTPCLDNAGVMGTVRSYLLNHDQFEVTIAPGLERHQLQLVEQMFICNSVFGVWPVREIITTDGTIVLPIGPQTRRCQSLWEALF